MRVQTNEPVVSTNEKFPDTVKLEVGVPVVGIMMKFREVTQEGRQRMVLECLIKGHSKRPDDYRTIWWPNPRKFALPPLSTPFRVTRKTQGEKGVAAQYVVEVADTKAESNTLWNGELGISF